MLFTKHARSKEWVRWEDKPEDPRGKPEDLHGELVKYARPLHDPKNETTSIDRDPIERAVSRGLQDISEYGIYGLGNVCSKLSEEGKWKLSQPF